MKTLEQDKILHSYQEWLKAHTQQMAQVHQEFLKLRKNSLENFAELFGKQIAAYQQPGTGRKNSLFGLADLQEFATGSIVKCLGEEYSIYAGRRSPPIPNGDLLLMSRIAEIHGQKRHFDQPSTITAEYDVLSDAWFFDGEVDGHMPISIVMEIGLQPCGFLSAYLETSLQLPNIDFFLRNLDGQIIFTRTIDARGKTITIYATLLKTVFSGSTIIQHFAFELSCEGMVFFKGQSTFGYFPAQVMAGQAGLDAGKESLPWIDENDKTRGNCKAILLDETKSDKSPQTGKLNFLHKVVIHPNGGRYHGGYVYACRTNSPSDWYYACHFHEDPVMPGSLGIEAITQAMKAFARQQYSPDSKISFTIGRETTWKYRGQVLQHHRQMQIEIHLKQPEHSPEGVVISGDANLWADNMRIYEIHNLSILIKEG